MTYFGITYLIIAALGLLSLPSVNVYYKNKYKKSFWYLYNVNDPQRENYYGSLSIGMALIFYSFIWPLVLLQYCGKICIRVLSLPGHIFVRCKNKKLKKYVEDEHYFEAKQDIEKMLKEHV
jgi:hypothetical protein